ncbi:MAG: caspase family protein, partial [Jaaginema sp. PMC 1079.18]|nr:caspase family protein [Jaaginema sp. PMC 1079.18]
MAKYALVIGIPEYQSFAALPNTTTDAEAIAQLLESQGHFQAIKRLPEGWNTAKNDYEVAAQGLTGKTLGDTLKTFLLEQATQSDAVIYFTGHGFTIADNLGQQSGYLATSDCCVEWEGDRAVGQRYGISLDSLNALIQQANLSSLVLLLDCCHSGFFIEQSIVSQSLTALLRKDYYLITSSRSFESSWSGEKHSVFTGALLNSLSASNAGSDGYVTVDRVFDFIQRQLRNSGQEPVRLGWGRSIGLIHYPPSEFEEQNTTLNPQNPYLGLQAFEGSHTTYFYGRETAINALLERLSKGRFLSVIGASGCGKSSLVKAGLIPKLQDNPLPDSNQWAIAQFTPGSEPLHRLLNTLAPLHNQNQPFLVFIDQFEEIFTQCKDEAQRRDFFRLISEEATTKKRQGRVVIAVRGDFLDRCAEYNEIAILINRTQPTTYFVEPLSLSELEAAIVKPAEQHGVSLEPGLAAQMAETVAHQPGALPLLQYALQQLWRVCITEADSTHPYLTWAGYEQIEGVGGALEKRANLIYNSFGQESDRDLVRRLFLELVELGDGNTVFRRQQSQKSLNAIADSPEQLQFVLERLSQERLIVITTEKTGENTFENYVEVTHEALLCRWELLRTWIDQNRDNIRLKRRFEADCLAWRDRYEESEDALLTGLWLSDIIAWKEQENPRLLPTENQFIAQSIARRDRDFQDKLNQERKLREEAEARVKVQKQKKRLAIATSLVICLLSIVTLTVNDKRQRSDTFLIGSLVGKAEQLLKSNHQIDALIASIEALQEIKKRNLGNTENIKRINTILAEVNEKNYFLAEDGGLYALDFVSKSNNIVTGGTSGNIKTFTNKVSPIPSVFSSQKEHEQAIWNIASDFQKNTFVTAGLDNFIKLWTTNGDFLGELNHGEKVYDVIFWKQHYLISSGANSNILIWDRRTKRKINEITDPNIENVEKYYIFA